MEAQLASGIENSESNPYLAAVYRKYRNLRKKADKIHRIEVKLNTGADLNDEQLAVLSTKASVEKSLSDMESVKLQIEEIAAELAVMTIGNQPKPALNDSETNTIPTEVISSTTQVDAIVSVTPVDDSHRLEDDLFKIFRLFHVCGRYSQITGKSLPDHIDYFGKSLLGLTSITNFQDTLQQSLRAIRLYLDDEQGSQVEIIRGITYKDMSLAVDALASEFDIVKSIVSDPEPDLGEEESNVIVEDYTPGFIVTDDDIPIVNEVNVTVDNEPANIDDPENQKKKKNRMRNKTRKVSIQLDDGKEVDASGSVPPPEAVSNEIPSLKKKRPGSFRLPKDALQNAGQSERSEVSRVHSSGELRKRRPKPIIAPASSAAGSVGADVGAEGFVVKERKRRDNNNRKSIIVDKALVDHSSEGRPVAPTRPARAIVPVTASTGETTSPTVRSGKTFSGTRPAKPPSSGPAPAKKSS